MEDNNTVDTQVEVQPQAEQNVDTQLQGETVQEPTTPLKYEIDGIGEVTPDEIKQWKQGALRQSDYTRKTQELAKQRKETQEAVELYEYLRNNPQVAQALSNGQQVNDPKLQSLNPANKDITDLQYEMATIKLDQQLNTLKSKYPDLNEIELLQEAQDKGENDLEYVYNAIRGRNIDSLKDQIAKQVRAEINQKIQSNNQSTKTIVGETDKSVQTSHGLSEAEKLIAAKMGLSEADYANGKN